MFNPFANIMQTFQQLSQFEQNFQGNPQQQTQQMLNSGQMSQEQLNQILPIAEKLYMMRQNMMVGPKK